MRGIEGLVAALVPVVINHVLSRLNGAELPDFIDFVADRFPRAQSVTLSFVAPVGRARDHAWIIPPIEDLRPALRAGIARAEARGVRVRIPDRCGVPPCVLPEHAALHDSMGVPEGVRVARSADHHHALRCRECALEPRCIGLWKAYAEVYGDGVLSPLVHEGTRLVPSTPELAPSAPLAPLPKVSSDGGGLSPEDRARYLAGERRGEVDRLYLEAAFFEQKERLDDAVRLVCQALALDPHCDRALRLFDRVVTHTHVARARARHAEGSTDEARRILAWVLAHRREHPAARRAWAELARVTERDRAPD